MRMLVGGWGGSVNLAGEGQENHFCSNTRSFVQSSQGAKGLSQEVVRLRIAGMQAGPGRPH